MNSRPLRLDPFAARQFDDPSYAGTKLSYDKQLFEDKVNEIYASGTVPLVDGYAPFCKHLFIPNFTDAKVGSISITPENQHLLRSGYVARRPSELPVLSRWFSASDVQVPVAKVLDLILYSKEQIDKESEAMKEKSPHVGDYEWGIIGIKGQDENHELPMSPITMMRNSLGKEEGGSGVPIDREAYMKSVEFWEKNAIIQ
jgi:hypothetical protein